MGLTSLFIKKKKGPKKTKVVKKVVKKKTIKPKTAHKELSKNECPECGSRNIVISQMTGNTICQDCGAIFAGLMPEIEQKFQEVKKQG
ncbi:MAG: TFIIB-type zinc ribbon-containing protein [Nanoarchaeota archaeon]